MNNWSDREKEIATELAEQNLLYKVIVKALKREGFERSTEAVRCFLKRNKKSIPLPEEKPVENKFKVAINKIKNIKNKALKSNEQKFNHVGRPKLKTDTKILCLSDFHIPFENPDTIMHAIENHGDADILVINGDILDQYSVSKWPKSKEILLQWEYSEAIEWFKLLAPMFKEIHITSGNHDNRLKSYFSDNIDKSVSFLVCDDLLSKLADGYDFDNKGNLVKTYDFNNVHYNPGLLSWYTQIGKCLFVHPNSYSKVPMKTVTNVCEGMLDREEFQAIVIGHTHKIGKIIYRNRLLIEQGCCCVPLDYEADGKMRYQPQSFGYAVVYQDKEGNVDFDKSNPVYLGTGFVTKEDIK